MSVLFTVVLPRSRLWLPHEGPTILHVNTLSHFYTQPSLAPLMAARDKKYILTIPFVQAPRYQRSKWTALGLVALLASVFAVVFLHSDILYDKLSSAILSSHIGVVKLCPQSDALYPKSHARLWNSLGHDYDEGTFLTRAVAWLGGAVRIPYVITYAFRRATFF